MSYSQFIKRRRAERSRHIQWLLLAVVSIILSLVSGRLFSAEAASSAPITVIIDNVTQDETDSGTSDFVFTISLSEPASEVVKVDVNTLDSEFAVGGDDYVILTDHEVTFPIGSESQEVTVQVIGEELVEADEAFAVMLTNARIGGVVDASRLSIADDTGIGSIGNEDAAVITVVDFDVHESDGGYSLATVDVTLDKPVDIDIKVSVRTKDDTALSPADYLVISNPLEITFQAGAADVKEMGFGVNGDSIVEADETFDVELFGLVAGGRDVTIGNPNAVVTIVENDSASLSVDDVTVIEGDSGTVDAIFTVTLDSDVSQPFEVPFSTLSGSASSADGDFVANSGTLNFNGVKDETQQIVIEVNGDTLVEATEQFSVTLGTPDAGGLNVVNADGVGVGTITADDSATITLSGASALLEGDSGSNSAEFTITLSGQIADFTLDFATEAGTALAGSDFVSHSETLSFTSSSALSQTVTVDIIGDETAELDELFTAVISNAVFTDPAIADQVTINVASVNTTITNDDVASIAISDSSIIEGNSGSETMVFTVTLSNAADKPVTVSVNSSDDSAAAGSDYTAVSGQVVTFTPGGSFTKTVLVSVAGDITIEPDETFDMVLSNPRYDGTAQAMVSLGDGFGLGTIISDDAGEIALSGPTTVTEGDSGTTVVEYVVTLSGDMGDLTLDFATEDGSASGSSDYDATTQQLSFTAGGALSQTVTFNVQGDEITESDETFTAAISNVIFAESSVEPLVTVTSNSVETTISNDDTTEITISDASVIEGDSGTQQLEFIVALSSASADPITLRVNSADLTATAGSDYTVIDDMALTFTPGAALTQTVLVAIAGDTMIEPDESFALVLSDARYDGTASTFVTISDASGTGTILGDDNGTITISGPASVVEGNVGAQSIDYVVTLSGNMGDVSIDFATADNGASAGSDYTAASQSLSFTSGGALSQTISVIVNGDTTTEPDERFIASISNITFAANDTDNFVTIDEDEVETTIANDDASSLRISDASIVEGDTGSTFMEFVVSLSASGAAPVAVDVTTVDVQAVSGSDYIALSDMTVTFSPGDALTKTIQIEILSDTVVEADETFNVQLSNPLYDGAASGILTISDAVGVGMIDNDDFVDITIGDTTANEADGEIEFVVTLSEVSAEPITLTLNTSSNGPEGKGFTPTTDGIIVIPAGVSSYTLTVPIANDSENGPDVTYVVTLSDPINANLDDAVATATVADNDSAPTLTVFDLFVDEAAETAQITAMLSGASGFDVTLNYQINPNTAVHPDDYTGTSGQVTIPAGAVGTTIDVSLVDDSVYEGLEYFNIVVTDAVNALLGDVNSTIVIADNEAMPTLFVNDAVGAEADGSLTFTVSLASESALAVTVNYALVDGSAESPDDYTAANGTLVFPAGTTSQQVVVPIIDDNYDEENETFTIELSDPINATVGSRAVLTVLNAVATATIIDDDTVGIQVINPHVGQPLQEGGSETMTITLDSEPIGPVTVTLMATPEEVCSVTSPVIIDESNWDTGVPVTITAIQDYADNGDQACTVEIVSIVSTDPGYNNPPLTMPEIEMTVENRDPVTIAGGLSYSTPFGQELIVNEPGVMAGSSPSVPMTVTVVGEPEHGTLAMNPDGSFSFMPSADFDSTTTFTYTVTDGYSVVTETATIVGFQVGPNVADTELVNPDSATTLSYFDEVNNETSISIPAGTVTETMTVILERLPAGPPNPIPAGLVSADETFNFDAYPNGALMEPYEFDTPVTITIEYDQIDVQALIESELEIRYWDLDAQVWIDAATTCEPTTTYVRDLENNTISIQVCQTGEFTLVGVRVPTAVSLSNSNAAPAAIGTWLLPLLALLLAITSGVIVSRRSAHRRQLLHL